MTGIIIQARMGSTRLPGKIMMEFCGKTLLEHILCRLERRHSDAIVVIATSTLERDDVVEQFCRIRRIQCFRGEEENVLKRYYDCAVHFHFTNIVRMTGDNPLPDIEELDHLIQFHIQSGNDYSECFSVLPVGVGVEIFTFEALKLSMENAYLPHHFEHVDEYILENKDLFKTGTLEVPTPKNYPNIRLTVDTLEDYERMCRVLKKGGESVATEEAVALCLQFV